MNTNNAFAIVSSLRSVDCETPVLTIHSILESDKDHFIHIADCAIEYVRDKVQSSGKFFTSKEEKLHEFAMGDRVITPQGDKFNVWVISEKSIPGWMSDTIERYNLHLGSFVCVPFYLGTSAKESQLQSEVEELGKVLMETHMKYNATLRSLASLKEENQIIIKENENTSAEYIVLCGDLAKAHKRIASLEEEADQCKMLQAEIESLRKSNEKDMSWIRSLYDELADLKRSIVAKDNEICELKHCDAPVQRVQRQSVNYTPVYSEAVNLIKVFDHKSLLSRSQRDELLRQKSSDDASKEGNVNSLNERFGDVEILSNGDIVIDFRGKDTEVAYDDESNTNVDSDNESDGSSDDESDVDGSSNDDSSESEYIDDSEDDFESITYDGNIIYDANTNKHMGYAELCYGEYGNDDNDDNEFNDDSDDNEVPPPWAMLRN